MHFQEFPVLHIRLADVLHHDLLVPAFFDRECLVQKRRPWEAFLHTFLRPCSIDSRATRKIWWQRLNLRFKNADKLNF